MTEEQKRQIRGAYEELRGVLISLEGDRTWFDDNGFAAHINEIIDRVIKICPEIENINSYKIRGEILGQRGLTIDVIITRTKLNSLIGRLKGSYDLEVLVKEVGNTFIQNQSQNQSQSFSMALELQEKILSEIPKHKVGSKERNFLEKFKLVLPSIKTGIDILAGTLKIGSEMGLDSGTIHKLLGL